MVGWHHQFNGLFEQTPGDGKGQRSLTCCSPWGCKRSQHFYSTPQCTAPGRQQHHLFLSCSFYLLPQSHTDTLYFSDKFSSWRALSNNNLERSHHSHSCLESNSVTSFPSLVSLEISSENAKKFNKKFVPPKQFYLVGVGRRNEHGKSC